MKFLIAFAFVAVASAASIVPIRLPEPMAPRYETPDFGLLIVPAEVMEAVRVAELNAILAEIVPTPVKFIDSPLEATDEGLAVKFVDVAVNAETPVEAVKVVETVEDVASDEGLVVKFVEEAVNADHTPLEAVKAEQVASEADEGLTVKFVDVAVNAEETPAEIPVEAVKVVESVDEVASDADLVTLVKFVEVAENQETADIASLEPIAQDAVVVVEDAATPLRYPGKQFANPLLRSQ